jgi:NAD-dependent dihydropyrimidine dehydrogenase PreA subunit
LSASDRCAGHGVCVASCATQALRWYEADGLRGVEFTAERCTACGDCVERCPEQALGLQANGNGMVPAGAVRLSGHALRCCARCEDEFMTDGDEAFCPGCRKDVGLFHDLAGAAGAGATENEEIKTEEMT